jgi:hypothetical protein
LQLPQHVPRGRRDRDHPGREEIFRDRVTPGTFTSRFSIEGEKIGKVKIVDVGLVSVVVTVAG